jgi:hypothetical protein
MVGVRMALEVCATSVIGFPNALARLIGAYGEFPGTFTGRCRLLGDLDFAVTRTRHMGPHNHMLYNTVRCGQAGIVGVSQDGDRLGVFLFDHRLARLRSFRCLALTNEEMLEGQLIHLGYEADVGVNTIVTRPWGSGATQRFGIKPDGSLVHIAAEDCETGPVSAFDEAADVEFHLWAASSQYTNIQARRISSGEVLGAASLERGGFVGPSLPREPAIPLSSTAIVIIRGELTVLCVVEDSMHWYRICSQRWKLHKLGILPLPEALTAGAKPPLLDEWPLLGLYRLGCDYDVVCVCFAKCAARRSQLVSVVVDVSGEPRIVQVVTYDCPSWAPKIGSVGNGLQLVSFRPGGFHIETYALE